MLGYADYREVLIWVQTQGPTTVAAEYWQQANPAQKWQTQPVKAEAEQAFTVKCLASSLEPGVSYEYRILLEGKPVSLPYPTVFKTQPLWQWRNDPPAFSVATGSCAYVNETQYDRPGNPYGSNFQIYTSIHAQRPDLMLWLGDNVYYREVDWSTRSGMMHRYTHTRALPELQPLLASTNHYAIWDDHDFGPNDSDGSWIHKETAWEVFKAFWGNPTYGLDGKKGCTTQFQYGDIDFFLLDNRYFRTPNNCESCPERTQLGKEQLHWLMGALASSRAPFKIVAVGGQVLTTVKAHETYSNLFPAERDSLLNHIERENIKGVIFLTGDRHYTEMSMIKNALGNEVYELTASPLTSGVFKDAETKETSNTNRIPGTVLGQHNFAMLRFSGPRLARQLTITLYDVEGKELWAKTLTAPGP